MPDTIDIEILEDGTISVKTEGISDINHFSADQLLDELDDLLGGKVVKVKRKDKKAVIHDHKKAFNRR